MIFYFSSLGHASLSSDVAVDWVSRKAAHVFVFATLAFLVCAACRWVGWRWPAAVGLLAAALYGVSDEVHQSFVVGRSPLATDVLIDTLGALLGVLAWRWLVSRRSKDLRR